MVYVKVTDTKPDQLYIRPKYRNGEVELVPYMLLEKTLSHVRFLTPYGVEYLDIGSVIYSE